MAETSRIRRGWQLLTLPARHHLWGSLAVVLFVQWVIGEQIADRTSFAGSELHQDVMDRWGAPIDLPAPSARWVASGTVFTELQRMAFTRQQLEVDTVMNYRRRGLVYFSGFDFTFSGRYGLKNEQDRAIDIVFVFPVELEKNRVLLSDLSFTVDGARVPVELGPGGDKLIWTGRLAPGQELGFTIGFRGRGLDSFVYRLDPELAVRDFSLALRIAGGANFDYPPGVVSASRSEVGEGTAALGWRFAALESGVPVGVTLPSEQPYDELIATMLRRAWAPFLFLFGGLALLGLHRGRRLRCYESYLIAAGYALFFVLLAYLAAFLPFAAAYLLALGLVGSLLTFYLRALLHGAVGPVLSLLAAFLLVPTLAVLLQGLTGLIYTLEIGLGVAVVMGLSTRPAFRRLLEPPRPDPEAPGASGGPTPPASGPPPAAPTASPVAAPAALVGLVLSLLVGALPVRPAQAQVTGLAAAAEAQATLPLAELLRLVRLEQQQQTIAAPARPPLPATLDSLELSARLYEEAMELTVAVRATVLDERGEWVQLPLVAVGPETRLLELPALEDATLVVQEGWLTLLSRRAGRHELSLSLLQRAVVTGPRREAALGLPPVARAVGRVVLDESLFRLTGEPLRREGDALLLLPRGDRFVVGWERLATSPPPRAAQVANRPPLEPRVDQAFAALVGTLEGRQLLRLRYLLRLEGSRTLELVLPSGFTLQALYVDGAARPLPEVRQPLSLELRPDRPGDQRGTLELLLLRDGGPFALSGELALTLPALSWPVHELQCTTHLPEVFEWRRSGGSLEQLEERRPAEFTHPLPEPGRLLVFGQQLVVGSAPTLRLRYTIDLQGQYFRPGSP
ncbi:MAG: hypothetical protein RBU45_22185 [Myxococcota bacterium]|jgi:hypothetical protein|nr:hypothetical protein [Myxococcota bacterium]